MTDQSASSPQQVPAFKRKSASYEAQARVQRDAADWLAEWLPEGAGLKSCLEFGAGTGLLTRHLPNRFAAVEVSDVWPEMLDACRARVPGPDYRIRDAWLPQNDPGRWDYLVSSSLLQWAPDPPACLENWRALLREDGRILAGFFVAPSLPEMISTLGGRSPVRWRSSAEWRKVFETAGFEVLRMKADTRSYHYGSALEFWKSLHGTGATVSRQLSPGQMRQLLRDYGRRFKDAEGVYATWTFCRVELRP